MNSLYETIMESNNDAQKIFIVIKPGFLHLGGYIINKFKENGWSVEKTIVKKLLLKEAQKMYKIHKKESFYKPLCEYMASDICRAFILTKPGYQSKNTFKSVADIKDEIREKYGESDMRNVLHSSDSMENMIHEASIFFGVI